MYEYGAATTYWWESLRLQLPYGLMTGPIQNTKPQSVDWEIGNKETKASERLSPYSTHSSSNPLAYTVLSYLYILYPLKINLLSYWTGFHLGFLKKLAKSYLYIYFP